MNTSEGAPKAPPLRKLSRKDIFYIRFNLGEIKESDLLKRYEIYQLEDLNKSLMPEVLSRLRDLKFTVKSERSKAYHRNKVRRIEDSDSDANRVAQRS